MTTVNVSAELRERVLKAPHVYRGKDGSCCCGCSGKHRYTKASAKSESKGRGYPVRDDEINDSYVRKITTFIWKNLDIADVQDSYVSVVKNGVLYIAYDAR